MNNALLEAALEYAARGWAVFPCVAGNKAPLNSGGCRSASTDPKVINAWWLQHPNANVGIACGPISGIAVVDIDIDQTKTPPVDGWKSLDVFEQEGHTLPNTVRSDSPRGGAHYLYKVTSPDWPANKNNYRNGIDIRSDGYYIVGSPSVHPNGKIYKWGEGSGPGDLELAEFPDFMRPELEKKERTLQPWELPVVRNQPAMPALPQTKPITAETKPQEATGGMSVIERASLYLAEVEPACQGHAGHDALLWAARCLVVGFELSEGVAAQLLWQEYNPRCSPPWNASNPKDAKDFNRKISQALSTPSEKPRGWLLDELGLRFDDDSPAMQYGEDFAQALISQHKESLEAHEKAIEFPPSDDDSDDLLAQHYYPDWIVNPPGMVGDICRWINDTAGCQQPVLTLGAALTACGAIFGRKVRDLSDGRTNIYGMGVAHSSAGKDHASDCVSKLLVAAGGEALLGGNNVTSDAALEVSLEKNFVQLFLWDEIGHMMSNISGVAGTNPHLASIVPTLMKLYSSSHKMYIGKQYADVDKPLRRIDQPHACVWGYTSPDILYKGITVSELRDGWLGRIMTFISHERPRYIMQPKADPPKHLVEMVTAWISRTIESDDKSSILSKMTDSQILVPNSDEATAIFDEFGKECHSRMIRAAKVSDDCQYLWGKALQNARRVALIISAGEQFTNPEINEYHAKYGCELARLCVESFSKEITRHIAAGVHDGVKKDILEKLRARKDKGMSKADLTRATQGIKDRRQRDAYIDDLIEAKLVILGPHPDYPRARAGWLWATPYGFDLIELAQKNMKEGLVL